MKSIIDSVAQVVWSNHPSSVVSPEICLADFPLLPSPCLFSLCSKVLGVGILAGALFNKAPLLVSIWRNRSVAGMSVGAVYGETMMCSNAALYNIYRKNPFTAWGENCLLFIQNLVVIGLMWSFSVPTVPLPKRLLFVVVSLLYLFVVLVILPSEYVHFLITANTPVMVYSRGSQILTFHRCGHTGTQSLITTLMNLLGSCIRLLTTVSEIGWDIPLLSGYLLSVFLNIALVSQFFAYKEDTKRYLTNLSSKKDD